MEEKVAPELSVIIATHDRRGLLGRCLRSLREQTAAPRSFEVIVAADGCGEETERAVAALRTPFDLRYLPLEKAGKVAALNAAVEVARGVACLFVDDDVIAAPELVEQHLRAQRGGAVLGIGHLVEEPPQARDWFARAFARAGAEHYEGLRTRPARWTDCFGANFSAPRRVLQEVGGFSRDFPVGEDFEIAFRLHRAGCAPVYLPDAVGVHDDQKPGRQMLEDARRQGQAHVRLAERFPQTRPQLLDWSAGAGRAELAARRLCLMLRIPVAPLARLGALLPGEGRRMLYLHFVRRLSFWRGVEETRGRDRRLRRTADPERVEAGTLAAGLPLLTELLEVASLVEVAPL